MTRARQCNRCLCFGLLLSGGWEWCTISTVPLHLTGQWWSQRANDQSIPKCWQLRLMAKLCHDFTSNLWQKSHPSAPPSLLLLPSQRRQSSREDPGPVSHFIFITTFYHPHYLFSGAFLFCLWSNNCSSSSFLSVCCYNYRLNCVFRRHQWIAESWIRRQLVSSCSVCKLLLPGEPCLFCIRCIQIQL